MRPTLLALALASLSPAFAHPGGHAGGHGSGHAPSAPQSPAPTAIPALYGDVVAALRAQAGAAGIALDSQKIVDLHRAVRTMTDLAKALPPKAAGYSAEAQASVNARTAAVQRQLDALLGAADKGDTANGKVALTALQAELDALAALK